MLAFVRQKVITWALFAGFFLPVSAVYAQLPVRNHNPLTQNTGLPSLWSARLLDDGRQVMMLNNTLSSHFVPELKKTDPLFFDGESYVTEFIWKAGIGDYQLRAELPWVGYHHGFMDDFIIDWHDAFGLPGADREKFDNDVLLFSYQQNDSDPQSLVLDEAVDGFADVRLGISGGLGRSDALIHAWHAQLKLPTGNERQWLGSGSTDVSLFISGLALYEKWQLDWQYGVLWMSEPEFLADQRKSVAGFGSFSLAYWWTPALRLIAQIDGHSGLYDDSQQRALDYGLLGTLGMVWEDPRWRVHAALLEDLYVDSAPDVGFQLGFSWGLNAL